MRTTIDLSETLYKKLKTIAFLKGMTLKKFITFAIEHELEANRLNLDEHRITLPLVPSNRPGSVSITPEDIAKILEREDLYGIL